MNKHVRMNILVFIRILTIFILITSGCGSNDSEKIWLDDSFGKDGIVTTFLEEPFSIGKAIAVQSDGKIVLAGSVVFSSEISIVRYNTDGSLDTTFGTNGIVTIPETSLLANNIVVQLDGKIIIGASDLFRFNTDGSTDTTFGDKGVVKLPKGLVEVIAIQSDEKIIVGGSDSALVRYNEDGSLDVSFGSNGIVTMTSLVSIPNDIVLQSDGKIVITGYTGSTPGDFSVVRYNTDGNVDTSFGSNGIVNSYIDGSYATNLAIQADGRIIVAGNHAILVRYKADGSLDTAFGTDGIVTMTEELNSITDFVLQSDGKVVITGYTGNFGVARYHTNGEIDTEFGEGGIIVTDIQEYRDKPADIIIQSDGKILVGGTSCYERYGCGFALVRYLP